MRGGASNLTLTRIADTRHTVSAPPNKGRTPMRHIPPDRDCQIQLLTGLIFAIDLLRDCSGPTQQAALDSVITIASDCAQAIAGVESSD